MGRGGWSVINNPQTKQEFLDWGLPTTNSPVVGGAPGYGLQDPPRSDDPARSQIHVCSTR